MKRFIVAGLLALCITQAVTAQTTRTGYIRYDPASFVVQNNVLKLVNQPSSGGGGTTTATTFGVYVSDHTSAGVQAAINAASPGTTLIFDGTYTWNSGVLLNKKLTLLAPNAATFDGGTTALDYMMKINNCDGVRIENIKWQTNTGSMPYGLVLVNEEGPVTNFTVTRCEFTAPNGNFNLLSGVAWSEVAQAGTFHANWTITDNFFHDCGRMGIELVAHAWNGSVRFRNLNVSRNRFINLGINTDDGMGISFSGEIQDVICSDNRIIDFRGYGIEFIGTFNFSAQDNVLRTSKTFGGSNNFGSNGYNLTDGGNTEQKGNPNRGAHKGSVTGGSVDVSGRPFLVFYAYDLNITGGYWKGGLYCSLQHGQSLTLTGLTIESLFQSCLVFDGTSNSVVTGGRFSTINAVGGKYGQLWFQSSSRNNSVVGTYMVGVPDNNLTISYDSGPASSPGSSTGNRVANVYYDGGYINN